VIATAKAKNSQPTVSICGLRSVINKEKFLPAEFINTDGFGITEAARRYLAPLIAGEAYPAFKNGLPDYVRLQNVATPKKLTRKFFVGRPHETTRMYSGPIRPVGTGASIRRDDVRIGVGSSVTRMV
jgi:hypothetical protein